MNGEVRRGVAGGAARLLASRLWAPLILGLVVFAACLFGILTRPTDFLATIWPANALMLGLLLRVPRTAGPAGWMAAAAAFVLADLLAGSPLVKALILNFANMAGVAVAYMLCRRLAPDILRLRHPLSMLYVSLALAGGSVAAGIVGGIANPILFGKGVMQGFAFWFATELVNHVLIVPVILAAPSLPTLLSDETPATRHHLLPVTLLVLSGIAAVLIGGPGAIAFPVPALLWCGIVYPLFPTALLTLAFGGWTLGIISAGYIPTVNQPDNEMALISVRLGAALIALAPVMLASVMRSREDILRRMRHLAMHDSLTGASSRSAFMENAARLLHERQATVSVLMIDLDHFKAINDRFGHAAGDRVLAAFAQRAQSCLRPDDVLGRLGGEEFAVLIPACGEAEAIAIAERIRSVMTKPVMLAGEETLIATVSIGLTVAPKEHQVPIDHLLFEADRLLYIAKQKGRDRIETSILAA